MPIEVALPSREEWAETAAEMDRQRRAEFAELRALDEDLLDEDGYPTEHACLLVERWHWDDPRGWLEFIEELWHLRSWGWHEEDDLHEFDKERKIRRYNISTAGWSGNEALIRSMEANVMLWSDTWVQSRRGGHYIFEIEHD